MNTRTVFTSPVRTYTAIEPLESRIAPAITLLGVPNWLNEGPGQTTGGQVEGMGDNQVVGAVEKIAAHPTNADIVYVVTVHGGIWKTGNATAANPTWTPLTETLPATGFASIAFDPTDAAGPEEAFDLAIRYAESLRRGEWDVVHR